MKKLVAAAVLAASCLAVAAPAEAAPRYNPRTGVLCSSAAPCNFGGGFRRGRGGSDPIIIDRGNSGIDPTTLLLLGLGGGTSGLGGSGLAAILPLLLQNQNQGTTVIESGRRGRR
jgi:hypothetical protein